MNNKPSLIELIATRVASGDADAAKMLFGMVAESIRSRLDPADSKIVAAWFDRLANGEKPAHVFKAKVGRPRNKHNKRRPMGSGRIPDDLHVAWLVHQNVIRHCKPSVACRGVAKALGMNDGTVRNIYNKLKNELS